MKKYYSFFDKKENLYVDCSECRRGGKGDKSCASGWKAKIGNIGGCFNGEIKNSIPVEKLKKL